MKLKQLEFDLNTWGGARKGAGRKPLGRKAKVPHGRRARFAKRFPLHVTSRVADGLPSLRDRRTWAVVEGCLRLGAVKPGFRVVHYSVQRDHLHLLIEADDRERLGQWMKGLLVRLARALNRCWGRKGNVFLDRFHHHVLRSPKEVFHAIKYVLRNGWKHGAWRSRTRPDPCSSGPWFLGWTGIDLLPRPRRPCPAANSRTWMLSVGWLHWGDFALTPG